jgi:hypothetical protein
MNARDTLPPVDLATAHAAREMLGRLLAGLRPTPLAEARYHVLLALDAIKQAIASVEVQS